MSKQQFDLDNTIAEVYEIEQLLTMAIFSLETLQSPLYDYKHQKPRSTEHLAYEANRLLTPLETTLKVVKQKIQALDEELICAAKLSAKKI